MGDGFCNAISDLKSKYNSTYLNLISKNDLIKKIYNFDITFAMLFNRFCFAPYFDDHRPVQQVVCCCVVVFMFLDVMMFTFNVPLFVSALTTFVQISMLLLTLWNFTGRASLYVYICRSKNDTGSYTFCKVIIIVIYNEN